MAMMIRWRHTIGMCEQRFDALVWTVEVIRDSSLVTDPDVCARLEEIDRLLGRETEE